MSIYVTCLCGQEFETAEANAGKSTLCPICGRVVTLPRAASAPAFGPPDDLIVVRGEPVTSRAAMMSFGFGAVFFFACLTGVPAILLGYLALREIRRSEGRRRGKWLAIAGIVLGVIGCLFTAVPYLLMREAREAARRVQCASNLQQIALAMHNYHDTFGCLPPAAITDKNGKPLLSWRVAILPFLDTSSLYADIHLDEPWDSPHNLSLLPRMPYVFRCPSGVNHPPGMTTYQVIVGADTAFRADMLAMKITSITDGTQYTILVTESRQAVPWTKPDDIPVSMAIPLTGIGTAYGYHGGGFNVAMVDASVRFVKNSVSANTFRAAVTRNGNEVIDDSDF